MLQWKTGISTAPFTTLGCPKALATSEVIWNYSHWVARWHSGSHCCLTAPGTLVQFPAWVTVQSLHIPRFLRVLPFPSQSKDVWARLIGHAKLTLCVRGISRVNMWGYGDKAWVGLWSVQTRWAKWPLSALWGFYDSMISAKMREFRRSN